MCDLIEPRPEDIQTYFAYLRQMYHWIHWNTHPSWDTLQDQLRPLTDFYLSPQTEMSRTGILCLLGQIQNEMDYQKLVTLQGELISVLIIFDGKYKLDLSGEGPYTFFYFIYKNPEQAMEALNRAAEIYAQFGFHTHHILEYLFRVGPYVAGHRIVAPPNGKFMDFFLRRSCNFLLGIDEVRRKLAAARIMYDAGSLVPTDGDMHCDGKVPCYLTLSGEKYVYKPRDMRIDCMVTEAFAFCSQFLKEEMQPPSLRISLLPDTTGLMQFAVHADQMSSEEAGRYFTKLGALLCISKLFGVRDLHCENIMATLQGPVIIDMECALSAEAIKSEAIYDASLVYVQSAFSAKRKENATFQVDGQIPSLKDWAQQIQEGFLSAASCLYNQRSALKEYYQNLLRASICYRIVPVATEEFYDIMHQLVTFSEQTSRIETSLLPVYNTIMESLYKSIMECIPKEQFKRCLKKNFLMQMVYLTLFHGNIPILHMEVKAEPDGTVFYTGYINGVPFFEDAIAVTSLDNLGEAFVKQIQFLNSKKALQSIDRFIGI